MAKDPSRVSSDQFAQYQELVAEYKASAFSCEASLDQLKAAERELRALAAELNVDVTANKSVEIDSALRRLTGRNLVPNSETVERLSTRERAVFELISQGS